jgi:hypothetical protein
VCKNQGVIMNITENVQNSNVNKEVLQNSAQFTIEDLSSLSGIPTALLKQEFFRDEDVSSSELMDIEQVRKVMVHYLNKEILLNK